MANAAVLKTADRKVLQVRILCPPLRALVPVLPAAVIALALLPIASRPACACTIKHTAYRAAMRSDLRNLVTAQESFRSDSGRFTTVAELIATGHYLFSAGVHLDESSVSDTAYTVRVRHEASDAEVTCSISVGMTGPNQGEPVCGRFPRERAHVRNGIIYFVLLAVALALRVGVVVAGHCRFVSKRLLLLPALALAHPYWDVLRGQVIDDCWLGDLDLLWIGLVAASAIYLVDGPEPPAAKVGRPAAA